MKRPTTGTFLKFSKACLLGSAVRAEREEQRIRVWRCHAGPTAAKLAIRAFAADGIRKA